MLGHKKKLFREDGIFISLNMYVLTLPSKIIGQIIDLMSNIETNKVKISLTLLINICNALNVTMDYMLENEYHTPTSTTEKELFNTIKDMDTSKLETLLRIAKVL